LADVVIFLKDFNSEASPEAATEEALRKAILQALPPKCEVLEVLNKSDLLATADSATRGGTLLISAKTGDGIDGLKKKILEIAGWGGSHEGAIIARRRHLDCLDRAAEHIDKSQQFAADGNISWIYLQKSSVWRKISLDRSLESCCLMTFWERYLASSVSASKGFAPTGVNI